MSEEAPPAGLANVEAAVAGVLQRLDAASSARERALPLCRSAIRHAAQCIRAVHRRDFAEADGLLERSRADVSAAAQALADYPEVFHAGFLHDAQKEYAEAACTLALVAQRPLPSPATLHVEGPAYLHGLAETIGELRRYLLDAQRRDALALDEGERVLALMDAIYGVLVTIDHPDALTHGLRRATDVARSILERTRGDYTLAVQQERLVRRLAEAQERLQA